ncbi:hypothetical protein QBZ16_001696 [Prototheca wickerhamii]|uniref:K Homology domain-containing protein n=1 Tax=Prototheca wickerhamii TaxID=3111 RepID=A0AAD9MK21_PROWI|nr:hypothetical protein QBZ16_001696 [Prototheca wickerhamii]
MEPVVEQVQHKESVAAASATAPQTAAPQGKAHLRVLLDAKIVGGFIGKGGESIQARTRATNTSYGVDPLLPGCDSRVIGLTANSLESQIETLAEALVSMGEYVRAELPGEPALRLLVPGTQVGQLLGRGGSRIETIRRETGAEIRVLARSELSLAARLGDEEVSVGGPGRGAGRGPAARGRRAGPGLGRGGRGRAAARGRQRRRGRPGRRRRRLRGRGEHLALALVGHADAVHGRALLEAGVAPGVPVETSLTLLVPAAAVGPLVGRGGEHIERLRRATGATVRLASGERAGAAESMELVCTSAEDVASTHCAAQEALLRAFLAASSDEAGGRLEARVLVPADAAGLILGRRGAVVSQLRAEHGAGIHVGSAGLARAEGEADDEADAAAPVPVTVEGALPAVAAALRAICTLLRVHYARRAAAGLRERRAHAPHSPSKNGNVAASAAAHAPGAALVRREFELDAVQAGAVLGKAGANITQARAVTGASRGAARRLAVRGAPDAVAAACSMLDAFLLVRGCATLEQSVAGAEGGLSSDEA